MKININIPILSRVVVASAALSATSFWIARAVGLPVWKTTGMGDASDVALYVFIAIMLLGWPRPVRS